jgi:phthalate 4,5-cis-dihydrodiol dehydrogenase
MLTLPSLIAHPNIQLVGGYDPRQEATARFARDFDTLEHQTLEALLADPLVEAIYVASPHEFHREQAIAGAAAGKHLLIDKPMAASAADCLAIEAAATAAGILVVVGPSHGFDVPVARAAELIREGAFGLPRMLTGMNYTDFVHRPRRPEELDRRRGGGVVLSQAAHQIDVARRLMGSRVEQVRGTVLDWDSERRTDGAYTAHLQFNGGAAASLSYSGYGRYCSDDLFGGVTELGHENNKNKARGGTKRTSEIADKIARTFGPLGASDLPQPTHHEHFGWFLVSCEEADLRLTPDSIHVYRRDSSEVVELPPPSIPRAGALDEIVRAVRFGEKPVHDARWGALTVACCEALLRSSDEQQEIAVEDSKLKGDTR